MPTPSTKCDIDLTGDLKMALFDAGVTSEAFYWNIHGEVVLVAICAGIRTCVRAPTPEAAIWKAAGKLTGGL